ncbi:hypothetical protein BR93DRAFT_965231 [Coniochaeta sp. PMI_546]|nr:hypothetical protein BR93DRAFT_965231 [Coniochaeta sp. PMI_546]
MNNSTASCPAVSTYDTTFDGPNNPTTDHIGCFGAYQTGPAGINVSQTLRECCNNTVIIVNNNGIYDRDNPSYGHCWYFCNVTQSSIHEDTGYGFYQVQRCIQVSWANHDYDTGEQGKYDIQCLPKREPNAAVNLSVRPLSTIGFGLVLLVLSAIVLA